MSNQENYDAELYLDGEVFFMTKQEFEIIIAKCFFGDDAEGVERCNSYEYAHQIIVNNICPNIIDTDVYEYTMTREELNRTCEYVYRIYKSRNAPKDDSSVPPKSSGASCLEVKDAYYFE